MTSNVRKAGLVALVSVIIGVGVYGCKKEEQQKEDMSPTVLVEQEPAREGILPRKSVPLEEELYKQTKIAFVSRRDGNNEIYVMNGDGSNQRNLTNNLANDYHPSWSPDGKKIVFASNRDGNWEIYVMNVDGTEQKNLTATPADDESPCWSSDGKKIAFESGRDGNSEIYIMNSDGNEQTRLTNNPAYDGGPSWSPDNEKIAFQSERDGNSEIYIMNADGSNLRNVTNNPVFDAFPSWSPGKKIAFHSHRDDTNKDGKINILDNPDIYIMSANGSKETRLTKNPPTGNGHPAWSPDGKKMLFVSNRDGNNEIYIMNSDGSKQKGLTNNPAYDIHPCWSPFLPSEINIEPR